MDIIDKIHSIKPALESEIKKLKNQADLDRIKGKFLGKKGELTKYFTMLRELSPDERPHVGKILNEVRNELSILLEEKWQSVKERAVSNQALDTTLPGKTFYIARKHILTQTMDEIKRIFTGMGFSIAEGPELETDYYNFEALNIPQDHPSRDMQDTFYVDKLHLLRTHTSPVQVRTMEKQKPPIRIIAPGKVFRRDTPDATHSPVFHQVEGLYVDRGVSFSELKGTILAFARALLGPDITIRFRPSFFPFTEPSAEYDFSCIFCRGKGCSFCKWTGWLEISGAGMVDPEVFRHVGIDAEEYTGFAFGMGVERIALLRHEINDIRLLYQNDLRFLEQF